MDKLKGIDLLLKAWKFIGESAPKLIVCGTGPMEDWCKEYIKDNNLKVELKGFVPNSKALEIIGESKALILPTQWYEGFPMTIVEAFSVGTPILCSNFGNSGSIVDEGMTGYKFQFDSVDGIVETVKRSVEKPLAHEEIIRLYLEKYSCKANYKVLEDIYNRL